MRIYQAFAIAAVVLVAFGMKLFFFSPAAEADVRTAPGVSMDVSQMHVNRNLPVQQMHDMTFVFSDHE
jgi:hypothetical protein